VFQYKHCAGKRAMQFLHNIMMRNIHQHFNVTNDNDIEEKEPLFGILSDLLVAVMIIFLHEL
jgi:hypothetical protein